MPHNHAVYRESSDSLMWEMLHHPGTTYVGTPTPLSDERHSVQAAVNGDRATSGELDMIRICDGTRCEKRCPGTKPGLEWADLEEFVSLDLTLDAGIHLVKVFIPERGM